MMLWAISILINNNEAIQHHQAHAALHPRQSRHPSHLGPPRPSRHQKIPAHPPRTPLPIQQTTEEKHFTFFDAASPTFMVVNPEVAEGDLG